MNTPPPFPHLPQDATITNNILSSVKTPTPLGNIINTPKKRGNDLMKLIQTILEETISIKPKSF